jgi:hypothetical protein
MFRRGDAASLGVILVLAAGLAQPASAYRRAQPPTTPVPPVKDTLAPAEIAKTVSGIIKGQPAGTKYTVVAGKRSTVVDANKAVVRNHGRFAGPADLKPGSYIKAVGSMNGATFVAKTIDIVRAAGAKSKKKK